MVVGVPRGSGHIPSHTPLDFKALRQDFRGKHREATGLDTVAVVEDGYSLNADPQRQPVTRLASGWRSTVDA